MTGMKATDDHTRVCRAIQGDQQALCALWQMHRRWVAAILLAHKPKQVELDDLLQEVAMLLVKNIKSLKDPAAFKGWLRTIAINTARVAARSPARTRSVPLNPAIQTQIRTPVDQFNAPALKEEASKVLNLALQLPEAYREPLILRCVQGLSYRRIATVLSLPETTIETRIARARKMVRQMALADQPLSQHS